MREFGRGIALVVAVLFGLVAAFTTIAAPSVSSAYGIVAIAAGILALNFRK